MVWKSHPKEFIEKFTKKVYQYTPEGVLVKEWFSIIDIKRELKIGRKCLKKAIVNQFIYHGYIWKFKR